MGVCADTNFSRFDVTKILWPQTKQTIADVFLPQTKPPSVSKRFVRVTQPLKMGTKINPLCHFISKGGGGPVECPLHDFYGSTVLPKNPRSFSFVFREPGGPSLVSFFASRASRSVVVLALVVQHRKSTTTAGFWCGDRVQPFAVLCWMRVMFFAHKDAAKCGSRDLLITDFSGCCWTSYENVLGILQLFTICWSGHKDSLRQGLCNFV